MIDYKKFIEVWNSSDSPQEVADKMKMSKSHAVLTACRLRTKSIILKIMKIGRPKIDWTKYGGKNEQ